MLVAVILAAHPLALPKAGELLLHKKADQRLTAVQILCRLDDPQATLLLQQALHNEVNDDARDLMLETLGGYAIHDKDDETAVARLVAFAKKRGKLSRPVEKWLDENSLPPLYLLNGNPLTTDMLRFLLYRMSRVKEIRSDVEAKPLLRLIDRCRSGAFAAHLFKLYTHKGGDPKLKYLLTLAALTGDEALADELYLAIQQWIDGRRLKMAEHGMGALAIHGSANALRAVEFLSRKYRVRKAGVGAAALAALQNAAAELDIDIHELGDRIVPDFGFDGLYRYFEAGGEVYRAFIDSQFKVAYLNNHHRRLKAMPAATSAETKTFFKTLGKAIIATVKLQSPRMEHFLATQRKWKSAQWQQFFLRNPVMFVYATQLVWGLFDEQEQLIATFYCREDATLRTANDTEITLPATASVRLLRDAAALQQWKHTFASRGITPLLPQLESPLFYPDMAISREKAAIVQV